MPDDIETRMAQDCVRLAQAEMQSAQEHLSIAMSFGADVHDARSLVQWAQLKLERHPDSRDHMNIPGSTPAKARWN